MNPTLQTIFNRKSVRQYTGKPVKREDLTTLIHAGMAAPCSWGKCCWYFIAVDEMDVIQKLADGLPNAKMLLPAKHAIVVLADLTLAHGGAETPYWIQDCSATTENILIAAEALGLGACWTGVHPRAERAALVQKVLGVPEHVMPLCVIAVGHPSGEEKPRTKIDAGRIFWGRWGGK